ncbi:hypothetical protein GGQ64_000610 [Rhizobium azooxidifex]|uniref:Ligand-binding protein with streptavidin-like fold n=1 Tax=Mycoplana azooxidifex TaxID=1636188 RepID=A0A7W6DAQ7_9HYPH|nr:Atu4866 domain-containing protein [Mycoplana azooxidifex]MBB3975434.1 hypothetical protein [Mycoplana azooxidifex]
MRAVRFFAAGAIALFATVASGQKGLTQMTSNPDPGHSHPYVGMWITGDGHIRHELLPNGRYDEARGSRESAYRGRYEVTGDHIEYWDDTGFTADGDFIDGVLHHGGMILYRDSKAPAR